MFHRHPFDNQSKFNVFLVSDMSDVPSLRYAKTVHPAKLDQGLYLSAACLGKLPGGVTSTKWAGTGDWGTESQSTFQFQGTFGHAGKVPGHSSLPAENHCLGNDTLWGHLDFSPLLLLSFSILSTVESKLLW